MPQKMVPENARNIWTGESQYLANNLVRRKSIHFIYFLKSSARSRHSVKSSSVNSRDIFERKLPSTTLKPLAEL